MLCADVSHKIMRADTVYDYLDDLFRQYGNDARFHDTAMKNLVGEIVLTRSGNSHHYSVYHTLAVPCQWSL